MGMNPETNSFEKLSVIEKIFEERREEVSDPYDLLRSDGTKAPKHWCVLRKDEEVIIKNYTFKVAYFNETTLILEPVGIPIIKKELSDG